MENLDQNDWQQIALFYQRKFNDLELKVLAMELEMQKTQQAQEAEQPVSDTDE